MEGPQAESKLPTEVNDRTVVQIRRAVKGVDSDAGGVNGARRKLSLFSPALDAMLCGVADAVTPQSSSAQSCTF